MKPSEYIAKLEGQIETMITMEASDRDLALAYRELAAVRLMQLCCLMHGSDQ